MSLRCRPGRNSTGGAPSSPSASTNTALFVPLPSAVIARKMWELVSKVIGASQAPAAVIDEDTADAIANKLCRYVLLREHLRKPVSRTDMKAAVMSEHNDRSGKIFKQVLAAANARRIDVPLSDNAMSRALAASEDPLHTFKMDGKRVKLQIWDTAGQERYRAITRSHYRRAAGAVLIYDCTDPGSLKNAQDVWLPELISSAEDEALMRNCIMLVGNKTDLPSDQQVSSEVHDACQQDMGVTISQRTSARTGDGVEAAFGELIQRVYELRTMEASKAANGAGDKRKLFRKSSSKSSCC